jgi:hypothetical protein
MTRDPVQRDPRFRTTVGAPRDLTDLVETPTEAYPLRKGGKATPDRNQPPRIGPACYDTDYTGPPVVVDPETNAGPEVGAVDDLKSRQEHGDRVTETRHGQPTMPSRPGQHS